MGCFQRNIRHWNSEKFFNWTPCDKQCSSANAFEYWNTEYCFNFSIIAPAPTLHCYILIFFILKMSFKLQFYYFVSMKNQIGNQTNKLF